MRVGRITATFSVRIRICRVLAMLNSHTNANIRQMVQEEIHILDLTMAVSTCHIPHIRLQRLGHLAVEKASQSSSIEHQASQHTKLLTILRTEQEEIHMFYLITVVFCL